VERYSLSSVLGRANQASPSHGVYSVCAWRLQEQNHLHQVQAEVEGNISDSAESVDSSEKLRGGRARHDYEGNFGIDGVFLACFFLLANLARWIWLQFVLVYGGSQSCLYLG
jgi:hypothetical protein